MENFEILRKIIRESLEQSFMDKEINVDAAANLIAEKVEIVDKEIRIAVLMEEREQLLTELNILPSNYNLYKCNSSVAGISE